MKLSYQPTISSRGATLLEMSIVIAVLLSLIGIGLYSTRGIDQWKLGREAGESLRSVYTAQRMFLADNPTVEVKDLNEAQIIPYLPNIPLINPPATTFKQLQDRTPPLFPVNKSLTGATLGFLVNQSPPKVAISGVKYDPSGSDTDSLWDVGK